MNISGRWVIEQNSGTKDSPIIFERYYRFEHKTGEINFSGVELSEGNEPKYHYSKEGEGGVQPITGTVKDGIITFQPNPGRIRRGRLNSTFDCITEGKLGSEISIKGFERATFTGRREAYKVGADASVVTENPQHQLWYTNKYMNERTATTKLPLFNVFL